MKNIFLILLIVLKVSNIYCQSLDSLDKKNGYKDFHFGDDYSKWKGELNAPRVVGQDTFYMYNGNCCKQLYGNEISTIGFRFNTSKKIEGIFIMMDGYLEDFSLLENIKSEFGPPSGFNKTEDLNVTATWTSKKIQLIVSYKNNFNDVLNKNIESDKMGYKVQIIIFDISNLKKSETDGF